MSAQQSSGTKKSNLREVQVVKNKTRIVGGFVAPGDRYKPWFRSLFFTICVRSYVLILFIEDSFANEKYKLLQEYYARVMECARRMKKAVLRIMLTEVPRPPEMPPEAPQPAPKKKRTGLYTGVILITLIVIAVVLALPFFSSLPRLKPSPTESMHVTFEVSNLTFNATEVEAGKAIQISVRVKNVGDLEDSSMVTLKIDGETEATKEVILASKETKVISFIVTRTTPETYIVSVDGLTGSFKVTEPEPEPIILEGTGFEATNTFVLERGLSIFHMTHDGQSNFAIWLYNAETGERVDLLVNEIGLYSGATIVGVTGDLGQAPPGKHLLDITADGNWKVVIEQPRPRIGPKIPQTFTGKGDSVSSPFTLEKGIVKFEMIHDGYSNFAIWLYDSEGRRVDLLVNEIGTFEGSKVVGVTGELFDASPGIHYLDITADGNWKVIISSV